MKKKILYSIYIKAMLIYYFESTINKFSIF